MSAPIETRRQFQPQPLTIPADFGGLTLKQSSFCDHYLLTGNATDATIKAGFTLDRNSASTIGARLLRNVKVQSEIKRRLGIAIASPNEVLERLTKQARADLTDILDKDGQFSFAKARSKRILKKLKVKKRLNTRTGVETIEHEFEIHDPQVADDKLARFHKLLTDKVESESSFSESDIEHLGQSLLSAMLEASARMKAQAEPAQLPATTTTTDGSNL